jgi:hypothetical protein
VREICRAGQSQPPPRWRALANHRPAVAHLQRNHDICCKFARPGTPLVARYCHLFRNAWDGDEQRDFIEDQPA